MAKKLLVKTPQTIDGINLRYDENKQIVYKESILELEAKRHLQSINSKRPGHLHHEFKTIDVEDAPTGSSNDQLKARLAELELEEENRLLKARIKELEDKSAAGGVPVKDEKETVVSVVAKIKEAKTTEEVEAIAGDDTRKGVTDAATKRISELVAS